MSATEMLRSAIEHLRARAEHFEHELRALVEISSHTDDRDGVHAAHERYAAMIPLACTRIAGERLGDHCVFRGARPASEGGVVLVGHMDTVFPRTVFAGYHTDGRIARGPGVLDMKGGLVVVAMALDALAHAGLLARLALTLCVVSDEEIGSPHSARHVRALATGARAALVFESGRAADRIITSRKGTGTLTALARGKAAHSGNAHADGANAIWVLARFIDGAQRLTDYDRGVTVNVGTVHGGLGKNTVPDHATAEVDLRYITRTDGEWLRAAIAQVAREACDGVPGTSLDLVDGAARTPLERTTENLALFAQYAACARAAGLGDGEMPLVGGGSDASTTSDVGVPSIDALGPRGAGFHTLDEHMELDTLRPKAEALVRFLASTG